MTTTDFDIISKATMLYYEQANSLFADYFISEKLNLSVEELRIRMKDYFGTSPQELAAILSPENMRKTIRDTALRMQDGWPASSSIRMQEMGATPSIIRYQFSDTRFGRVIVASAEKGVCYLAFSDSQEEDALDRLKVKFPQSVLLQERDSFQTEALRAFDYPDQEVNLYLQATPYQINVWKRMLDIPSGGLMSYSALAGEKKRSHALGNAVGSNPIAYLIPCHRMIPVNGEIGNYHWGSARKAVLICKEALTN